jgi:hypothetical protein
LAAGEVLLGNLKVTQPPRRLGGQQMDRETGRPNLKALLQVLLGLGEPVAFQSFPGGAVVKFRPKVSARKPHSEHDRY